MCFKAKITENTTLHVMNEKNEEVEQIDLEKGEEIEVLDYDNPPMARIKVIQSGKKGDIYADNFEPKE